MISGDVVVLWLSFGVTTLELCRSTQYAQATRSHIVSPPQAKVRSFGGGGGPYALESQVARRPGEEFVV
jgi:hypothetical protein